MSQDNCPEKREEQEGGREEMGQEGRGREKGKEEDGQSMSLRVMGDEAAECGG